MFMSTDIKLSYAAVTAKPLEIPRKTYEKVRFQMFGDILKYFQPICDDELFSKKMNKSIILSARVLLDKYMKNESSLIIPNVYNGNIFERQQTHIEILIATSLLIVIKWCSDIFTYFISDFAELLPKYICLDAKIKLLIQTEKDILKTLDYNIFKYMPMRSSKEILLENPIVTKSYQKPLQEIQKPLEEYPFHTLNPWFCLCWECINILDKNRSIAYETIPVETAVTESEIKRIIQNNANTARQNPYCVITQFRRIMELFSLKKGNPDIFWRAFDYNIHVRRAWLNKLRNTMNRENFIPYKILVDLFT